MLLYADSLHLVCSYHHMKSTYSCWTWPNTNCFIFCMGFSHFHCTLSIKKDIVATFHSNSKKSFGVHIVQLPSNSDFSTLTPQMTSEILSLAFGTDTDEKTPLPTFICMLMTEFSFLPAISCCSEVTGNCWACHLVQMMIWIMHPVILPPIFSLCFFWAARQQRRPALCIISKSMMPACILTYLNINLCE